MEKTRPIPVRLDGALVDRIERQRARLGISRSDLLRIAIINQLAEIESGRITLRQPAAQPAGACA